MINKMLGVMLQEPVEGSSVDGARECWICAGEHGLPGSQHRKCGDRRCTASRQDHTTGRTSSEYSLY